MRRLAFSTVVVCLVMVGAACSGDDAQDSTTTTSTTTLAPVTSLAAAETTAPPSTEDPASSSTTSAAPGTTISFPQYTIYSREAGESGDTLVVLLDPDSYDSLTDIDLANVLADVVDRFPPPILTAYVVDDEQAATAVLSANPTEAELELLSRHFFVRLEEGFRMVFAGPFADSPVVILGS